MLIVNPFSGRGVSNASVGGIVAQFCSNGFVVTVYYSSEMSLSRVVQDYSKNYDIIVSVGGDGTLSEVVSGLLEAGLSIPIGHIPSGTSNDVAITLALSKNPIIAAKSIIKGEPRPHDIGRFLDKYFTYIAAFGAFTSVAYSTPQSSKRNLGHFAYVLEGLAEVGGIKTRRTKIVLDDEVIEGDFVFGSVSNSLSVAGFLKINPGLVNLSDGKFEVLLVRQPLIPADFFNILSGVLAQTYDGDSVLLYHSSNVKFIFEEEVAWTIDGEDGGSHKEIEIKNLHHAIQLIT
jgi:YegS/Rv2252/BmrU family lipid kinase